MESNIIEVFDKSFEKAAKAFLEGVKTLKVGKPAEELVKKGVIGNQDEYTKYLNAFARELCYLRLKNEPSEDKVLMQASVALTELDQGLNIYYERLNEMYDLYYPEAVRKVSSISKLLKLLENPDRNAVSKELNLPTKSLGFNLGSTDLSLIKLFAERVKEVLKLRQEVEDYITKRVKELAPRTSAEATPLIAAKLITIAGSLKRLAIMPASTIQILGAEKALFRHLRTGAKPPKYGVIMQHSNISGAKPSEKGKASRRLANKIAIAVRQDYYEKVK